MPKIYVKTNHGSQEGWNDGPSGTVFKSEGWNYGIKTDRVGLVRFTHIPVPKGSTINSATLHPWWSGKNASGTAYTFTVQPYIDGYAAASNWLSTTRDEWLGAAHTWSIASGQAAKTCSWVQEGQPNYRSRQSMAINVKASMDTLITHPSWTLAGGSATFLLTFSSVSNPDNCYVHRREDNLPPILEIDYTPPASDGKQTVVNVQENCNFTSTYPWTGQPAGLENNAPHAFNPWFGSFTQPAYSVASSFGAITAPKGGNVCRVTSQGTGTATRSMIHFGVPNLDDGVWYNYSAHVYVPAGSPNIQFVMLGDRVERLSSFGTTTEKGSWQRVEGSFISTGNNGYWGSVQQVDGPYAAGQVFYVANVQLTKGKPLRPYIDGAQTLTGATYAWAGKVGTNGYVRAAAPVAALDAVPDHGRRKFYGVSWTYTQADGHTQFGSDVQLRRLT